MGHHFFVPGFNAGGFVGVTMFFVLSGFLITSLMREERGRAGTVNIAAFYGRRVRRLIPALVVLVSVVVLLGALRGRLDEVAPAAAASLFYVGNWAQLGDPISLEHLSHTWSLGVEEQFYLFWPLLFLLFAGRPVWAAIGLAIAATGARVIGLDIAGLERLDALMIGCLLALLAVRRPALPSWAGSGALLALGFLLVAPIQGPMLLTLGALLTVVVISASDRPGRLQSVLSVRPLVFVGRISYGLYLWHFAVGWEVWPSLASWHWAPTALILTSASFGLAFLSWRYVEQPILRRRWSLPRFSIPRIARSA
jgi:peptidoglycan/LPS O-acetylase OafA/YrhL